MEIHYPPEIIFSEKGHVAAKVLYQAGQALVFVLKYPLKFKIDTKRSHLFQGHHFRYPFFSFRECRSANL